MNFKFPSSLDNNPPIPKYNANSNSSYFSQQAIRAGYVTGGVNRREVNGITTTSDVRPREYEGFTSTNEVRHHEFEGFASTNDLRRREIEGFTPTNGVKRHEFEGFTSTSDVRRRQFGYSSNSVDAIGMNPIDVRGSMEREMAKERIRAEIIAEENRRRLLEEEVRRELMREKVSGIRHHDYGIGGSTGLIRMEPPRDPFSRSFEHRDRGGIGGGSGVWSHREIEFGGGFDTMPYNQDYRVAGRSGSGVILREIKEVDRVVDPRDVSKDKAIVLAKSSANLGYLKRKTMPPPVGGATEVFKRQKTKEHWRCALCQVSATSERGLKDHFQGKKHQSNEQGIVPHRTGFGTEPLPNIVNSSTIKPKPTVKPLTLLSTPSMSNVKKNGKRVGESSLAKADSAPLRNATHPPLKLKKTGKALATGKKNKQKKGFRFFCEMCQIGANSMIVFDGHKKGKKHLANLSMTNKTDEAAQNSNDTLVKSKGTSSNKRGNREAKGPDSGKRVMPKKKFQYFCEICQIGANSMTVFDSHMNGKKHSAKLSELCDDSARVEASPQKALFSGENFDGDFKKEDCVNSDGDDKEEIEETDGEKFEGDVKEEDLEETGGESFDGEELRGEDFDDDVNEELEETGGDDFDDDVNEELEETGGDDFDDDVNEEGEEDFDDAFKDELEEHDAESLDCDGSILEGVETVVEPGGDETSSKFDRSGDCFQ